MEELTTDQRLALFLRDVEKDMAKMAEGLRNESGGHPRTETNRLVSSEARKLEENAERLGELVEALAGGNVRVVDEYAMVSAMSHHLAAVAHDASLDAEPRNHAYKHEDCIGSAQDLLRTFHKMGALR